MTLVRAHANLTAVKQHQESQTFWDGVKYIFAFFIESKQDDKTLWHSCSI